MANEFLVGALLMAVSALTFVAYRHPRIYNDVLFNKLYLGGLVLFMLIAIWQVSHDVAVHSMEKFVPANEQAMAKVAAAEYSLSLYATTFIFFGFSAYLIFLSWLSRHFAKEHDGDKKDA